MSAIEEEVVPATDFCHLCCGDPPSDLRLIDGVWFHYITAWGLNELWKCHHPELIQAEVQSEVIHPPFIWTQHECMFTEFIGEGHWRCRHCQKWVHR